MARRQSPDTIRKPAVQTAPEPRPAAKPKVTPKPHAPRPAPKPRPVFTDWAMI